MAQSITVTDKLDDIAQYVPGNASDIAAILGVHVNTLRNIRGDGYRISLDTWKRIDDLHKKALKIKKIVGEGVA